jgi:hypothetical protein
MWCEFSALAPPINDLTVITKFPYKKLSKSVLRLGNTGSKILFAENIDEAAVFGEEVE